MNSPCSSETSESNCISKSLISLEIISRSCDVCGQPGHGKHYGATTCRACAAFFRRVAMSKTMKPCKKQNNCDIWKSGWFSCKKCRLQKCWDVGMKMDNFQYDRDSFFAKSAQKLNTWSYIQNQGYKIPQSMGNFLGRSSLIIFCAPPPEEQSSKSYIDVQFLVKRAEKVLISGCESPLYPQKTRTLQKLALGLQNIRGTPKSFKFVTRIGKDETFALWQDDMLKVAKWLTYFDDFQRLPGDLQLSMLKAVWKVWTRLENLAVTCMGRRQKLCTDDQIMVNLEKENVLCDIKKVEIDVSWCSRFTLKELAFFADANDLERANSVIQMMLELEPTDIELSFMLCQLCFHYVGKRYQGEIMKLTERFLEVISNDLHHYYVEELNMPLYSGRLASLMKVNNHIQKDIYRGRERFELAKVFDIFHVEFSHPEMFVDL